MSTLYVDNLQPNLGSQVEIPNFKPLAGSVVQVQSADLHTVYTAAGSGVEDVFTNTGLQVNITPTSASSKVLVNFNVGGIRARLGTYHQEPDLGLYRGATLVQTYSNIIAKGGSDFWIPQVGENASCSNTYLDSPSTTSQITYAIYIRGNNVSYGGDMQVQINGSEYKGTGGGGSSITVMEIAQ
jgi:hypothetical protein